MRKMRKMAALGLLVLLAVLVIPAASASEYYLDPDNSSVTNYLDTTEVAIWIDATENIRSGKITIEYDSSCGNITSCTRNTTVFGMGTDYINRTLENLIITYGHISAEQPADKYHIANFTIQCNSTTYCTSDLLFVYQTYARNNTAYIPTVTDNGTFTCGTPPGADLVVDLIDPKYIFANLNNSLFAHVTNQGVAASGPFDVCVEITNNTHVLYTNTVRFGSLNPGESTCISCADCKSNGFLGWWTPNTLENITINVTADCTGMVDEGSDEGNNTRIEYRNTTGDCDVDTMLPDTCYGYRGQHPLGASDMYNGTGKVIYTDGNSTSNGHISEFVIGGPAADRNHVDGQPAGIPAGATIKNATLYVYFDWRRTQTGPNPGLSPDPDFDMTFKNSSMGAPAALTAVANYTDMKGWAASQYQYGTMVYDVTPYVTGNDTYLAQRLNYASGKGYDRAISLMIAYDDGSGDMYHIVEGYDRLATLYWKSSRFHYYVDRQDATTTLQFSDVDPNTMATADLFTVAIDTTNGTATDYSECLKIDNCPEYCAAWMKENQEDGSASYISFNRSDATNCITPLGTDETVYITEGWQCSVNGFAPVFGCLQAKGGAPEVVVDAPDTCVSGTFTVDIDVETNGNEIYAVQYDLSFDPDVIRILDQHQGTFLSENGAVDTMVVINEFDNVAGTASYSETRRGVTTGTSTPGPLASITFTTVGDPNNCSDITLSGVVVSDAGAQEISAVIVNDSVCICEPNIGPTAVAKSDHKYNNVGSVFTCEATLNGSESYDPDGVIVQWSWACGDGGYESGEIAQHIYNTYQWNGSTYTPFTATLTVTDDDSATDDDDCEVIVYIAGDANGDGTVNILDAAMIGLRWMKTCNDYPGVCWGAEEMADRADLNNDCVVNILDAVIVGTQWGNNA
ncbi:hypothetical protein DRN85_07020 [Methanosarcinales archaeon]|nr:MAG: hypothetical protein DRN85_07020 [Methanosarcinales archaeon]